VEGRRTPRIQLLGRLHGSVVALEVSVTVTEISLGGMAIETEIEFPRGAEHEFQLTLGDESTVRLKGRVAHSQKLSGDSPRFLSGIEFVEESDPE
jgi:PilZ domain-containing protein